MLWIKYYVEKKAGILWMSSTGALFKLFFFLPQVGEEKACWEFVDIHQQGRKGVSMSLCKMADII